MTMGGRDDGWCKSVAEKGGNNCTVTISFGRLVVHLGFVIAVSLSVTIMLERYASLPHWMVANNPHGRSLAGIIGLAASLLVRRGFDKLLPLVEQTKS
ncbi:hypothetical protein [uncultured Sphingomonas sp.]|uniref:hypothetical protein n=1 Tax=uncultured Sphingomonas sp. TaxID=158754 RepID=UPI001F99B398|nr:hypothetical protein [uncultured Sphingomonas sp.]HIV77412.1 hypothetical protein [Candidatus Sphingomonas excrementigallinarum]